jgi:hypothetical protein
MSGEEYRRAMDTLARETIIAPESAARIERQLLNAFASREAATVPSPRMKSVIFFRRVAAKPIALTWRAWVPAAAVIVLVASGAFVWWMNRPLVTSDRPSQSTAPPKAVKNVPLVPAVERNATAAPAVEVARSGHPGRRPPKKTNVVTPSGFVDLPWTTGLPAFESGEIVRMDIPVASLPTYGIDISPGAGRGPVEADVLIGQDGFARQIRLVTTTSRSTQ